MEHIVETSFGRARLVSLDEIRASALWRKGLGHLAKDHRYYEIVDTALRADFEFRYLTFEKEPGIHRWIQPVFVVQQDLVATAPSLLRKLVARVRIWFPRFLRLRMLMAGCAAGEGHPSGPAELWPEAIAAAAEALPIFARRLGIPMVIWKDWPVAYRSAFDKVLQQARFARIDSMPATTLELGFTDFEDYMRRHLSHSMRKNLRRKFRATAEGGPVMSMRTKVASVVDEVHALYEQVYARSGLQFERLTKEFLLELSTRMEDRVRFFLWHHQGRLVACSICLIHDGVLYDEYLGLDYGVAFELHLYFVTIRDLLSWAMKQGLKTYRSTPLDYDPKLHLGFRLAGLDLYVAGASPWLNRLVRLALPWIEPTRAEPCLRRFPA